MEKKYQNIFSKADDMEMSVEDKNMVFSEIGNPMTLEQVIRQTSSPELAMEIYTASLLAIDLNEAAGQQYLFQLSQGLQLLPRPVHAPVERAKIT